MNQKVTKAVILAAGKGTRFLPYSKAMPKEMIAVVDTPAMDLIVDEIVESGIKDILMVISPDKQAIVKHFSPDPGLEEFLSSRKKYSELETVKRCCKRANISFVCQEIANGSGMALLLAEEFAKGQPVAVLNGDDLMYAANVPPVTKQLMSCYEKYGKSVLGVQTVTREEIPKYASCDVVKSEGRSHLIRGVIEKPKKDDQIKSLLAPLGRYIISAKFFDYIRRTKIAANGELQFTDSLNIEAREQGVMAYDFEGKRYDIGDKLGYLQATVEFALRDKRLGKNFADYLKGLRF